MQNVDVINLRALLAAVILLVFFGAFCSTALFDWHAGFYWHDQQRFFQVLFIIASAFLVLFFPQQALPNNVLVLLLSFFMLGFISSLNAEWPDWAFKEWGVYVGLMLMSLLLASVAQLHGVRRTVLLGMLCVSVLHVYFFVVVYVISCVGGFRILDASLLAHGFTNPRFFGQFQVMVIPVIAVFVLNAWRDQRKALAVFLCLILVFQWAIGFSVGARGLWLGLVVAYSVVCLIAIQYWRMALIQLFCGAGGFLIFIVMFEVVPPLLGIDVKLIEGGRTGLSGREVIWRAAWGMAIANPLLGVGPMHFAATYNAIAAHPHQIILQLFSEWGFLAGTLAIALGVRACVYARSYLRQGNVNDEDAGLYVAIGGALILAQVDGVFVMPYTETWLALLIGLVLARGVTPNPASKTQRISIAILAILTILTMVNMLVKDVPAFFDSKREQASHSLSIKPRFWVHGWIPDMAKASSVRE